MRLAGVRVVAQVMPPQLIDTWDDVDEADPVVVIDATHSGRAAGSVLVTDAIHETLPVGSGSAGTHAFGLAAAIELARALGRLPARLAVVGVESGDTRLGHPLSPAVAAAVRPAADAVLLALGRTPSADHGDP